MKKTLIITITAALMLQLCACGGKTNQIPQVIGDESAGFTPIVVEEPYDTIEDVGKKKVNELRQSLTDAMYSCSDDYLAADKGSASNIVLSDGDMFKMLSSIAAAGYSAVDDGGSWSVQNYTEMEKFCIRIASDEDLEYTWYTVYKAGTVTANCLSRESGVWHILVMSGAYDEEGNVYIYAQGRYRVYDVHYSSKGRLIFTRDFSSFDENSKANTLGYTMMKVTPYDDYCRTLCEKYIAPVGYLENNLFTVNWSEADFGPVDFNSLYAYLFGMYNGTAMLSSYNVSEYYEPIGSTRLYKIPTDTFETVTRTYFRVDNTVLKNISDYSSALGGYMFIGYSRSYYNVTPRTPEPEVVAWADNGDGTITMTVEAINEWYGTDCAFTHDVRVRVFSSGGFEYVSNTMRPSDNDIIPECKLCVMLDLEREKTNY